MHLNSRGLALVLAVSISSVVLGGLFIIPEVPTYVYWLGAGITFGTSYILINVVLEFLFFRELRGIYEMFERIRKDDFSGIVKKKTSGLSTLSKIYSEIYAYAQIKQGEIDELKRMAKFRRQFLADVSHELKTPIFAAQGFVHTLLDGAMEDKEIRMKFLKKAAKSLDGLDLLVQDLITISHVESGDITMHKDHIDITELVFEVFDQMEEKAEKAEARLVCNREREDRIVVNADGQRIYQVILNLVSNGVKYSKDGGEVLVEIQESEDKVAIVVKDDGIGIPAKHLNRIFERFYRVDKSRSKLRGGTGLGLSIVKHIIEAHDSSVTVVSTEGQGSEFSFELEKVA